MSAKRRIARIKDILQGIGIEPERVEMFNLSAAMANEFVRVTQEMTERIDELGPNPLKRVNKDPPVVEDKECES